MSSKKIITVFGATGAQGGGLARAILNDPDGGFAVRAVTRDASSDKAKALAAAGAEVVEANADDPASIDRALEGAWGAFFVTFFWEHFSPDQERQQAANFAAAAKKAGLKHAIWSTLEDMRDWVPVEDDRMPTLQERYKVPHFDAKGESDALFLESGVPVTLLRTSFYWDNFIHFGMGPQKGEDGSYFIAFPMGQAELAGIAAEDIGKCAYGIFKRASDFAGRTVGIVGECVSGAEMAAKFSEALGTKVHYNDVPADVYRSFGFPGADDLGNMFQVKRDFNEAYNANRDRALSRQLNPDLQSFDDWLAANKDAIPMG
ncbi:MAG: nucleoside-diphosphate sugar epimerase [Bacteroidetes bacterium CG12_big_fil_rev_8_21_14_0_65_60_17]|nr:MAG: nucleoside-diphosphate sugar epimerase [Bacteroidetes bacterium CG12_big_fil_rev_8_21_14_0_65_60_17]